MKQGYRGDNIVLKAFSSRHYIEIEDFTEKFEDVDKDEIYSFTGGFTLEDEDTKEVLAVVSGIFFDEDKILDNGENIIDCADMIDEDVHRAMIALSKSKMHNQETSEKEAFLSLFSCYLQRIYVYPQYRGRGIARYIFTNLEHIFLHCFDTPIHSFVIYPKSQQPEEKNVWKDSDDKGGVMLKRMIALLKADGYRQIARTGFYMKNCTSS